MRVKNVNIFHDIALKNCNSIESYFFDLQKFNISFMLLRDPILRKLFYFGELNTLKEIIFKGRGLRGGSDEKMRRMWLGLEMFVAGLPPLVELSMQCCEQNL